MKRCLDNIKGEIQALICHIKRNDNIVALYIFGSYGTKFQDPNSDLDFAILFKHNVSLFEELEIESVINQIFGQDDIDLVNLNKSPIDMTFEVLYTGHLLFCNDELFLADFRERSINFYGDYGIALKKFYNDFREGLIKRYGTN